MTRNDLPPNFSNAITYSATPAPKLMTFEDVKTALRHVEDSKPKAPDRTVRSPFKRTHRLVHDSPVTIPLVHQDGSVEVCEVLHACSKTNSITIRRPGFDQLSVVRDEPPVPRLGMNCLEPLRSLVTKAAIVT